MVAIKYNSNLAIKNTAGPRKLQILMPYVTDEGKKISCKAYDPEKDGLFALESNYTQITARPGEQRLVSYVNKDARWNKIMKTFVLNFDDRVTMPSVKNFQMVRQDALRSKIYLQFGRADKQTFNLDFRHPITPFQAFSIAVSSMDYKVCCE